MEPADRAGADDLRHFRALIADPTRHHLFHALRIIEAAYRDAPRLGESRRAAQDRVRLGQLPELAFPTSTLTAFQPAEEGEGGAPGRLANQFFGLFGPHGPLPLHLTEYARDRLRNHRDPTLVAFADMLTHRLMGLLYRAWAAGQPAVAFDRAWVPETEGGGAVDGAGTSAARADNAVSGAQYGGVSPAPPGRGTFFGGAGRAPGAVGGTSGTLGGISSGAGGASGATGGAFGAMGGASAAASRAFGTGGRDPGSAGRASGGAGRASAGPSDGGGIRPLVRGRLDLASDPLQRKVAALAGYGTGGMDGADAMPDLMKRRFAGRLASGPRNAEGLRALLVAFFEVPVEIRQFIGEWLRLEPSDRWQLGSGGLGQGSSLGSRVWSRDSRFRIRMGPLDLATYRRLLPGRGALERLEAIVRNYVGDRLDWDVQLVLRPEEVPRAALGGQAGLGYNTWAGRRRDQDREADDLILTPPSRTRAARALAGHAERA